MLMLLTAPVWAGVDCDATWRAARAPVDMRLLACHIASAQVNTVEGLAHIPASEAPQWFLAYLRRPRAGRRP
jgi:hypothetical protein